MAELLEKLRASLGDRYDVERELGEGGMATVFLARDIRHERRVALKVLHEDLGAALGPERFRREIQIATSLTHPHILALYDSGQAADSLFYVMPFIEGESLRQRIDREKMLPIDQALKICGEVASALDYAHRKGVVHRDIKPENILLEDGHAIVADFGIARAVSAIGEAGGALTKTGMSLGTPTYMSPEQAFGEKDIDGRSDLYSLACVLYEMLVGQPPFTGLNAQAIMAKHSMAEVPSMQIVRATIPDEVEDVVQKALSKSPADRFATVAEFAAELEECVIDYKTISRRVVADRRTGASRVPPGRRSTDVGAVPFWRRPAILGAAGLLVIALAGGAWWKFGRTPSASAATGGLDPTKVAVMYFQDVSSDGQLGYLADGLTESLISRLDEVKALDVVSPGGVAQFRGKDVSVDSIISALKVGTLVRGTVEPNGDKIRIRVRLVDGNTGEITRSEDFEQSKATIVGAQDSLAQRVAAMLQKQMGSAVEIRRERAGTSNAMAWTLVQRAQKLRKDGDEQAAHANTASAERSFAAADSLLGVAASMDPNWGEPLTRRSSLALSRARAAGSAILAKPWIEKGLADAQTVLAKQPRQPDALEMRGTLRYLKWAYSLAENPRERTALLDGAESDLKTATQIDPTKASAWSALSTVYSNKDDITNAKVAAQRAYEEDAYLSGTDRVLWKLYATSYDLQQFNDAVKYCDEGAARFPDNPFFIRCRLWLQTTKSVPANPSQAWQDFSRLQAISTPQSWKTVRSEAMMLVAAAVGRSGNLDSARRLLVSARPDPADDKEGELAGEEAFIRTLFGQSQDTTEAFRILNKYVSGSPQHRAGLKESQSWWWKGLKEDRRFSDLVAGAR
ncbi:MAG: protein kinase [Gemmatimonadales bacterium]